MAKKKQTQEALFDVDHPKTKAFIKNREDAASYKSEKNDAANKLKETDAAALELVKAMGLKPETGEDGRAIYTVPVGGKVYILSQNPSQLSIKVKKAEPRENPQDVARREREEEEIEGVAEPELAPRKK